VTPEDFVVDVATTAARSVRQQVKDLLARRKSLAYFYKRLRAAYPSEPEERLRAAIKKLERTKFATITYSDAPRIITKLHEPASDSVWADRLLLLFARFRNGLTGEQLAAELGTGPNLAANLAAAAESAGVIKYNGTKWVHANKETDMDKIGRKTIAARPLPCKLTAQEETEVRTQLRQLYAKLQEEESNYEAIKRQSNQRLVPLRRQQQECVDKLARGVEMRPVACVELLDYKRMKVRVIREDTKETLEERDMVAEERQMEIGG
jgi:hypothetical protein